MHPALLPFSYLHVACRVTRKESLLQTDQSLVARWLGKELYLPSPHPHILCRETNTNVLGPMPVNSSTIS